MNQHMAHTNQDRSMISQRSQSNPGDPEQSRRSGNNSEGLDPSNKTDLDFGVVLEGTDLDFLDFFGR